MINFKNSDFCKLLRLCAISALQISKKHFAMFDFFEKMKLVLTVWVSTSLSKFGYCTALIDRQNLISKFGFLGSNTFIYIP